MSPSFWGQLWGGGHSNKVVMVCSPTTLCLLFFGGGGTTQTLFGAHLGVLSPMWGTPDPFRAHLGVPLHFGGSSAPFRALLGVLGPTVALTPPPIPTPHKKTNPKCTPKAPKYPKFNRDGGRGEGVKRDSNPITHHPHSNGDGWTPGAAPRLTVPRDTPYVG